MPRLQNTIRGIKRSLGLTRRDRQPITLFILERIFHSLSPDRSSDMDTMMLWASFTLAFFGFMRCSELTCNGPFDHSVHLTRGDVTFFPNISHPQHMQVRLKKSKTDGNQPSSPSPSPIPVSVQCPPQGNLFSNLQSQLHRVHCFNLRMAPSSPGASWSSIYTRYFNCAVFTPNRIIPTASE